MTKNKPYGVTESDIRALHWAVRKAAEWRGSLMPQDYPEFNAMVARCKQALKNVRTDKRRIEEFYS